jgi:hypothetical protein
MIGVLRVKPGVSFAVIAPAGFRILAALDTVARKLGQDLTISSACDGEHSGPTDPHKAGHAYDVRTHDLPASLKHDLPLLVLRELREPDEALPIPVSIGLASRRFYAQLEHPGEPGEHIHIQLRTGQTFPPVEAPSLTVA